MKGKCEDCDSVTRITLALYGMRFMAEIHCPKCGVSYDTNIDDTDIEAIKLRLKTGQEVTA